MSDIGVALKETGDRIADAGEDVATHPWVERLTRFGYIIRGLIYIQVGVLAGQMALGVGGEAIGQQGAIATLGTYTVGQVVLILIAIGLAGYSAWGFIRAVLDPLKRGKSIRGLAERAGFIVSGLSYGALLVPTVQVIFGARDGLEDDGDLEIERENGTIEIETGQGGALDFTAGLLSTTAGPWIIAIAGLIAIAGGLGEWYRAISADFAKDFKTEKMGEREMRLARLLGRFGHAARGVVFMMSGYFLLKVGFLDDTYQEVGLDAALSTLARQSYGPLLLGAVALGLISFGVFSTLSARWYNVTRSAGKD